MTKKHTPPESNDIPQAADALTQAHAQAQEYLNNWKRERADFVNYKKDEDRRVSEIVKYSSEGLLVEIVEAMDGFISALNHMPADVREKQKDWAEGLDQAMKQFEKLIKGYGVERIAVEGVPFDPVLHEAVGVPEDGGQRLVEVRPGYQMHDKIIRPARVSIVK